MAKMQVNPEYHSHRIVVFHENQELYNRELVVFKKKRTKLPNIDAAKRMLETYRMGKIVTAIFYSTTTDQEEGRFENGRFTGTLFNMHG